MGTVKSMSNEKKPKFDPRKNYEWDPSDDFSVTGEEFSVLFHTLKTAADAPGGATPKQIVASFEILMSLLVQGVEAGVIREVKPPEEKAPAFDYTQAGQAVDTSSATKESTPEVAEPVVVE